MAELPDEVRAFVAEKGEDGVDRGLRTLPSSELGEGDVVRIGRTLLTFTSPGVVGIGPTLVPGELSATPRFSEQQQRILRELCRPLLGDGEGVIPASDEDIAAALGIGSETVKIELDHLTRAFGLEDMPAREGRAEVALLALRSGLVGADEGGGTQG